MKRRLFWTILIGFWLTFILITQGIWLDFSLARPDPEMSYMRSFARMSVAAASLGHPAWRRTGIRGRTQDLARGLAQPGPGQAGRQPARSPRARSSAKP